MNLLRLVSPRFLVLALAGAGAFVATESRAESHVSVGVSVGVPLPHGYAHISYGGSNYYYRRGTFYRPGPHGYYVVRPPLGCVVPVLPPYYSRVYYGGVPYFYYSGIYYQPSAGGYVVVNPPSTVVVTQSKSDPSVSAGPAPAVPEKIDYQTVWVGDVEYQFKDGQFFKKTAEGLMWTEAPLGAVTKNLPQDAKSVWYQDIEYFECDDVYFRKTAEGYKVVTAPWKR